MALVAGTTPGVTHLGQIKSQHLPIPDLWVETGGHSLYFSGTAPQELTESLSYIGYAKTIDNFWMDCRIFYIFFFKQLRISPG